MLAALESFDWIVWVVLMAGQFKRLLTMRMRKALFSVLLSAPIIRFVGKSDTDMPLGPRGELAAERFLLKLGYWIIDRGFGEKVGEIDLIVSDGRSVIFVEVKSRTSDIAGDPAEAVDDEKQRHITETARLFAIKNRLQDSPLRFDVIAILWPDLSEPPRITHFENAFEATGNFQMF